MAEVQMQQNESYIGLALFNILLVIILYLDAAYNIFPPYCFFVNSINYFYLHIAFPK